MFSVLAGGDISGPKQGRIFAELVNGILITHFFRKNTHRTHSGRTSPCFSLTWQGIVLFPPAALSFDEFKNGSERSSLFARTAKALIVSK